MTSWSSELVSSQQDHALEVVNQSSNLETIAKTVPPRELLRKFMITLLKGAFITTVVSSSLMIYAFHDFVWLETLVFLLVMMFLDVLGIEAVKVPGVPSPEILKASSFREVSPNTPGIYLVPSQTIHWISKTCTGIQVILFFIPLIFNTKASIRKKIIAITIMSVVIVLLNVVRIVMQLTMVVLLVRMVNMPSHEAYHLVHDVPTWAFQFLIFFLITRLMHRMQVPAWKSVTETASSFFNAGNQLLQRFVGRQASRQRALRLSASWTRVRTSMTMNP